MGISALFSTAKFKWNGTTWSVSDGEWWQYPLDMNEESASDFRRNIDGTARKYTRYTKQWLGFKWDMVGTTVRDYVRDWHGYDGTITVETNIGTWNTMSDDSTYKCSNPAYGVYNLSITLKEI